MLVGRVRRVMMRCRRVVEEVRAKECWVELVWSVCSLLCCQASSKEGLSRMWLCIVGSKVSV
jgi:hypothetical protein